MLATQVYQQLSVALQRSSADGVLLWRYAEAGDPPRDCNADPVHAALNYATINLAECDSDLRVGGPVAVQAEAVLAAAAAEGAEAAAEEAEAAAAEGV